MSTTNSTPKQKESAGAVAVHDHSHNHHHSHNHSHNHHQHGDDVFAHRSKEYDTPTHEARAKTIADGIVQHTPIPLQKNMRLMDFGAGTGLLTKYLAPHVGHITAVDVSPAMLEIFQSKQFDCDTITIQADLVQDDSCLQNQKWNGIVSAMTLHHVQDLSAVFAKLAKWITAGSGFIALADLDKEDGAFHGHEHKEGVFHRGHDRVELERLATQNGFQNVTFHTVDVIKKEQGDFPVFLMTATI